MGTELTEARFFYLLAGLAVLWVIVWSLPRAIPAALAGASIVAAHVLMFLAPPIGLSDAFFYLGFGRMAIVHGMNPYTHVLSQAPLDPTFAFVTWPNLHTPYGPIFTLLSAPIGALGPARGLWTLKLLAAASSLLLVWMVARLAAKRGRDPVRAALFVGLNPMLLTFAVAGAHNDVIFGALALVGLMAYFEGRDRAAGLWLAAAAGIKASAGLLIPFVVAGATGRRKLAWSIGGGLAVIYGLALVVWGPDVLRDVIAQGGARAERSVPGVIAVQLFGATRLSGWIPAIATAGFLVAAAALLARTWRGRIDWIDGAGWATLALLLSLTWLMPWYVVWLLPLAALARDRRLRLATIAFVFLLVVLRFPGGGEVAAVVPGGSGQLSPASRLGAAA
jgi:alpha-1,6-mannosyltransferase